jgi:hypothetical protein
MSKMSRINPPAAASDPDCDDSGLCLERRRGVRTGSLDPSFGTDGIVMGVFSGNVSPLTALEQANGDIVVIAGFDNQVIAAEALGRVRHTPTGSSVPPEYCNRLRYRVRRWRPAQMHSQLHQKFYSLTASISWLHFSESAGTHRISKYLASGKQALRILLS